MKKATIALLLTCVAVFAQQKGTFTDPRDGKAYKTVKIGERVWMAENLDYHGSDGYLGLCYGAEPRKEIMKVENCKKYGRLYDWNEAKQACPKGWHLPSNGEWQTLVDFAGGGKVAGQKLRSKSGWPEYDFSGKSPKSPKCKWTEQTEKQIDNRGRVISPAGVKKYDKCATDEYGFSALPGGYGSGSSNGVGNNGYWWSASEQNHGYAYFRIMGLEEVTSGNMYYSSRYVNRGSLNKSALFSVRCVKDNGKLSELGEAIDSQTSGEIELDGRDTADGGFNDGYAEE